MKTRVNPGILKKILITVPAAILLLALYVVIFGFSAQDAEQSGSLSMRISESAAEFLNSLVGGRWSRQFVEEMATYFEHPIRKLAHFGEYMCVGILVYLIWSQWMKRGKGLYLLTVIWVFVSGACDELHQLFVPGRWCSFADVCLDTCGGAFGLLLCVAVGGLWIRRKRRHEKSADGKKRKPREKAEKKESRSDV